MNNTKDIKPDSPSKFLILGEPFTGKSVFASTCPKPGLLFDFDNQANGAYRGLDFDYSSYGRSRKEWERFQRELTKTKFENYETVVLDSTTAMIDCAMAYALEFNPARSAYGGPVWNQHYMIVKNLIKPAITKIMSHTGVVVIIAHLKIDKDDAGNTYAEPLLTGDLKTTIPGQFGEVYCARVMKKDGKPYHVLQTIKEGVYLARSNIKGKDDLIPNYIPNDYESLMEAINKGLNKQNKKEKNNG